MVLLLYIQNRLPALFAYNPRALRRFDTAYPPDYKKHAALPLWSKYSFRCLLSTKTLKQSSDLCQTKASEGIFAHSCNKT